MRIVPDRLTRHASVPVAVAAITLSVAFTLLAGPLTAPLGLAAAVVAATVGPGVAILIVHLLAVAVAGSLTGVEVIGFELAIAPLIAAPLADRLDRRDAGVAWATAVGLAATVVLADTAMDAQWLVAATLVIVAGVMLYGLHRVELVSLDLIDPDERGANR